MNVQPQVQGLSRDASVRVLPADVYDALELAALVHGGIGAGWYATYAKDLTVDIAEGRANPRCIIGFACFPDGTIYGDVRRQFDDALGLGVSTNDQAVTEINRRAGVTHEWARVSFADWCAELRVVRGDT